MKPTVEIEARAFYRALQRLANETGKSIGQVLKHNAVRVAYNLMIVTQPWSGRENIRQHKGQHIYHGKEDRKLGEGAVMRDVGKVFSTHQRARKQIDEQSRDMAKGFAKAILTGNIREAQRILAASDIEDRNADVVDAIDRSEHKRQRNSRGRVNRHRVMQIGPKRDVDSYAKEIAGRVGFAKSAFVTAAKQIGKMSHVPAWVKRHQAPATARDNTASKSNPFVEFQSLVRYASKILPPDQVAKAIAIQRQKMLAQIDHVIAANARKAGLQAQATTPQPEPLDV